jgi:hypothetical protein
MVGPEIMDFWLRMPRTKQNREGRSRQISKAMNVGAAAAEAIEIVSERG